MLQPLTEKADIYSMGMIFYSLLSGKEPFGHTESEELKMLKGIMPDIDPSWHEGYIEVRLKYVLFISSSIRACVYGPVDRQGLGSAQYATRYTSVEFASSFEVHFHILIVL